MKTRKKIASAVGGVRARFVDGDCGQRVQNTNVVKGEF